MNYGVDVVQELQMYTRVNASTYSHYYCTFWSVCLL